MKEVNECVITAEKDKDISERANLDLQQEIGNLNKILNQTSKSYSELQLSSNQIEKDKETFKLNCETLN